MSTALIRAMANTLLDHGVDPLDTMVVVTRLITAGFSAKQIEKYYDDVVLMALIRKRNAERNDDTGRKRRA